MLLACNKYISEYDMVILFLKQSSWSSILVSSDAITFSQAFSIIRVFIGKLQTGLYMCLLEQADLTL